MISIKTPKEIAIMREGGRKLAGILEEIVRMAKPGISTLELEEHALRRLSEEGAKPAFKGYRSAKSSVPFTTSLCVSINHEVVHAPALPSRVLANGDVVGLDFGLLYRGFYLDMARTVGVGEVTEEARKLINITRESLAIGIAQVAAGNKLHDISKAIQNYVEKNGLTIIRDFVGHGIGRELHEPPQIPNYVDKRFPNILLEEGMCLAIEPMVVTGNCTIEVLSDGWTAATCDKGLAAHFEHTVAVTENGGEILTRL